MNHINYKLLSQNPSNYYYYETIFVYHKETTDNDYQKILLKKETPFLQHNISLYKIFDFDKYLTQYNKMYYSCSLKHIEEDKEKTYYFSDIDASFIDYDRNNNNQLFRDIKYYYTFKYNFNVSYEEWKNDNEILHLRRLKKILNLKYKNELSKSF